MQFPKHAESHFLTQVADLVACKFTPPLIAKKLGVSAVAVKNALAELDDVFRERAAETISQEKYKDLHMLDMLMRESIEQWWKSCENEVIDTAGESTEEGGGDGKKIKSFATSKNRNRYGDPGLLKAIHNFVERRAAMLGYDAPKKMTASDQMQRHLFSMIAPVLWQSFLEAGLPQANIESIISRLAHALDLGEAEQVTPGAKPMDPPEALPEST